MPRHVISPIIAPFALDLGPYKTCFLEPTRVHIPNGISIISAVFAGFTADRPYILKWAPFPHKCAFPWEIWSPSNTWFLRSTRVLNPNGVWIGLAIFAGLITVTDRQTTLLGL